MDILLYTSAAIGAISTIAYAALKVFRFIRGSVAKIDRLLDLAAELQPNGGTSLRDCANRMEACLSVVEQKMRILFEQDQRGIFEVDSIGRCVWTSPVFQEMTGLSHKACRGFGWINALHPDDREIAMESWEMSIEKSSDLFLPCRLHRPNGSVDVNIWASHLESTDGKCLGWIGWLQPVSHS